MPQHLRRIAVTVTRRASLSSWSWASTSTRTSEAGACHGRHGQSCAVTGRLSLSSRPALFSLATHPTGTLRKRRQPATVATLPPINTPPPDRHCVYTGILRLQNRRQLRLLQSVGAFRVIIDTMESHDPFAQANCHLQNVESAWRTGTNSAATKEPSCLFHPGCKEMNGKSREDCVDWARSSLCATRRGDPVTTSCSFE